MTIATLILPCLLLLGAQEDKEPARLTMKDLVDMFEQDATVTLPGSGIVISSNNCTLDKQLIEAITFRPKGDGPFPGVLLIPGYSRSARDYIPLGVTLAREGFASMAVAQPGFGRSEGPPDWVGPRTIKSLTLAFETFKALAWVDDARMGVFGYSRGAVASAILACRLEGLRAAVFASGIYDLRREYETNPNEEIRANMQKETGLEEAALAERSPLFEMESVSCPVLILHGEKDANASVDQAKLLRDRLTELDKEFEIRLYPDRAHDIGRENLNEALVEFLKKTLGARATSEDESGAGANPCGSTGSPQTESTALQEWAMPVAALGGFEIPLDAPCLRT